MIAEFVTRSLVLVLGYAYPAFQCFKSVERNVVELHELIFWCQYWIIVAVITVLESVGDVFISWVPMYGEMKLALFIYLWYPRTMGTGYVYDTLLRPYVAKHETDIDRSLVEFRDRAWNLAIYYWHNCTELGSTTILQFLQYVATQTGRDTQPSSQSVENQQPPGVTPTAPPNTPFQSFGRSNSNNRQPPVRQSGPSNMHRSETPKSEAIKVHLHDKTQFIRPEDVQLVHSGNSNGLNKKSGVEQDVQAVRHRLWRFIDGRN